MRKKIRELNSKLWWFDVVYPVTLALILFTSLTYIIYSGTRQMRLSSIADNILLQWSLTQIERAPLVKDHLVIVSADPRTLSPEDKPPGSHIPEASAHLYAQAITKISEAGVPLVYLSWDIDAHPSSDASYMRPLLTAISAVKGKTEVIVAAPYGSVPRFAEEFRDAVTIVDDSTCNEPDTLQTQCSFDRSWNDWVIQSILNKLGQDNGSKTTQPVWVSEMLNNSFPSYILNLSDPQDFPHLDITDLVAAKATLPKTAQVAFLGADLSGAISALPPGYTTRRVITSYDRHISDVKVRGTPLHVFWAQVAQMYLDHATVSIPNIYVLTIVVIMFCIFIFVVMGSFGGPAALGMFLVYVAAGPYANALSIHFLNVYIPLFDCYYFGLASFILAGFGRLSFSAFTRWRLEEQTRFHSLTADLKGNFISLLSHNLNTPVAKMQGMLAILGARAQGTSWQADIKQAETHVAQLELSIRHVLVGSALDEGSLHPEPRRAQALAEEFEQARGTLRRLGVHTQLADISATDDDLLMLPLYYDIKVFNATLAAACTLFADPSGEVNVAISFYLEEDADHQIHLSISLQSPDAWIRPSSIAILQGPYTGTLRSLAGRDFFTEVAAGLLRQTVHIYGGTLHCPADEGDQQGVLTIRLPQRAPDGTQVATSPR